MIFYQCHLIIQYTLDPGLVAPGLVGLIALLLFLYKNKKRGDLVNVWAMGWGWGSLLRSDSLARCEKQKDKHLWTDYSRLDIMHHLRYDGTYRLSLFMELSQGVDVNYVMPCMLPGHVSQGPFHSYGVRRHLVNRARNDVLHKNKLKEKLLSICLATCWYT